MEVTYTLTKDELPKYVRELEGNQRKLGRKSTWDEKIVYLICFALLAAPFMKGIDLLFNSHKFTWLLAAEIVVCLVWPQIAINLVRGYQVRQIARQPAIYSPNLVRIDADGIYGKNPLNEWKLYWSTITGVRWTKTFVWLLYTADNGIAVPKRAFANDEDAARFYHEAIDTWKKALSGTQS